MARTIGTSTNFDRLTVEKELLCLEELQRLSMAFCVT
jgi:hypothetical protein